MKRAGRTLMMVWCLLGHGCSGTETTEPPSYSPPAEESERSTDEARALNTEAAALIGTGDHAAAEAKLKTALGLDILFGPAHNNLGKVYYHQKRYYLSAWEFQYAAKLMPHRPEPKNNLGLVLEAVGKLDDAVKEYQEALRMEPDNPVLIGNLARARSRRGDRGQEMKKILEDLLLRETRNDWRTWAETQLTTLPEAP